MSAKFDSTNFSGIDNVNWGILCIPISKYWLNGARIYQRMYDNHLIATYRLQLSHLFQSVQQFVINCDLFDNKGGNCCYFEQTLHRTFHIIHWSNKWIRCIARGLCLFKSYWCDRWTWPRTSFELYSKSKHVPWCGVNDKDQELCKRLATLWYQL